MAIESRRGKQTKGSRQMREIVARFVTALAGLAPLVGIAQDSPPETGDQQATRLVEGRFDHALDASAGGLVVPFDQRFGRLPITIEVWVRVLKTDRENTIAANEASSSGGHWRLFTQRDTGTLAFAAARCRPAVVTTEIELGDGQWHHITATVESKRAQFAVDGDVRHDVEISIPERTSQPSGFGIGCMVDGKRQSDVLIDDLRISASPRDVFVVPAAPLVKDATTIALWDFDESEADYLARWTPGGETNQNGLPYPHRYADYEFEKDPSWIDGRWQDTNKGPFVTHSTLLPNRQVGPKNLTVFLTDDESCAVMFDLDRCATVAGVLNANLAIGPRRFGLLEKPTLNGDLRFFVPAEKVWRHNDRRRAGQPLEHGEFDFRGIHTSGERVVLEYTICGGRVYESFSSAGSGDDLVVVRELRIERLQQALTLTATEFHDYGPQSAVDVVLSSREDKVDRLIFDGGLAPDGSRRDSTIAIPSRTVCTVRIEYHLNDISPLAEKDRLKQALREVGSAEELTKPGRPREGDPLVTRGRLGDESTSSPYVVDTITVPFQNPDKALFFISGLDFLSDGTAALCTAHGDVWLVRGLDESLERVTWQRFATGLYQPLGLRVVDGKVIVLGRDQLTRLHDRNSDGEADFYESFNNDLVIQGRNHAFAMRLERDSKGNFYFLKSGAEPHGSSLLKVAADGSRLDVYATGFRHPFGMGIGPNDEITVADNEGGWVPSSKIDLIRPDGFYGFLGSKKEAPDGLTPDPPLLYIPKVADNSCGGQTWVTIDKWGPYHRGEMLHLSWGRCTLNAVLRDTVDGAQQAAIVRFPDVSFESGPAVGAFNPLDGQLYVVGLDGWQTAAVADGCFQRVRYTGQPVFMPESFRVHENGVAIGFTQPLDPATVERMVDTTRLEQWNYRWSSTYGSFHWSATEPDQIGHDAIAVRDVRLMDDGRSVFIAVDAITPVDQLSVQIDVAAADGKPRRFELFGTVKVLHAPVE